jgi:di/tricarboxylate transporter
VSALQLFSVGLLVVTFAVALWRRVNVGFAMLPAAFILALVAHIPLKKLFDGFPASLVVLVLGVMYLFGHAVRSGVIDRLVVRAEHGVGDRDWLLPWVSFLMAAVISAVGALPVASLAVVLPIAMQSARRARIDPMLMAVVTIMGALAGGFSPISVWGQLLRTIALKQHYDIPGYSLFALEFALNTALAIVAFFVYRGWALIRRGKVASMGTSDPATPSIPALHSGARMSRYEIASLAAVVVFVVAVLGFKLDVGLTAFTLGVLLHLLFRPEEGRVISALPWPVVLIIAGVLTYINLLLALGTLEAITQHMQGIQTPVLSVIALAYFASIFASFESSQVAVLAVVVPVALKVELALPHTLPLLLLVLTIVAYSAVVTSTSPFHVSGALAIANTGDADEARTLFRRLLIWTIAVAVAVPIVSSILPLIVQAA